MSSSLEMISAERRPDAALIFYLTPVVAAHGHRPAAVIQNQTRQREQPQKKQKIQPKVVVELAIPLFDGD